MAQGIPVMNPGFLTIMSPAEKSFAKNLAQHEVKSIFEKRLKKDFQPDYQK